MVAGEDGRPTTIPEQTEAEFPLRRPEWDPNTEAGKERLKSYRQTLLGGFHAAARQPTNLSKVSQIIQGKEECLSPFLERLLEAYRTQKRKTINLQSAD